MEKPSLDRRKAPLGKKREAKGSDSNTMIAQTHTELVGKQSKQSNIQQHMCPWVKMLVPLLRSNGTELLTHRPGCISLQKSRNAELVVQVID